jgi:hypothetical protein
MSRTVAPFHKLAKHGDQGVPYWGHPPRASYLGLSPRSPVNIVISLSRLMLVFTG